MISIEHQNISKEIESLITDFVNDQTTQSISINSDDHTFLFDRKKRRSIHEFCETLHIFSKSSVENNKQIMIISKIQIQLEPNGELLVKTKYPQDSDLGYLIRDYKLPIAVNREPYFSYFMDLYDSFFSIKDKYNLLIDAINHPEMGGLNVHSYGLVIADRINSRIKKSSKFDEFVASKQHTTKDFPTKKDIYEMKYVNEVVYISFDITTANFTAFKFYDPSLVLNCETWADLIKQFTQIEYFVKSKHFRQIVFGRMGSVMKKISSIQKYLTNELYIQCKDKLNVHSVSNDEIIIISTLETFESDMELCKTISQNLPEKMRNIWKIIPFSLSSLGNSKTIIKKNLVTNNIEIRHIGKDYYAQAFKYYTKEPLTQNDLKFMTYDGYLASFEDHMHF